MRNAAVHRNWNQRPEIREEMYAFFDELKVEVNDNDM